MCNALPAPRCSAYAEKRLESALRRGDVEDIVRATEGFLVTPRGIQSLRDQGELELAREYQFKRDAMFIQADRKAEVKRATTLLATDEEKEKWKASRRASHAEIMQNLTGLGHTFPTE